MRFGRAFGSLMSALGLFVAVVSAGDPTVRNFGATTIVDPEGKYQAAPPAVAAAATTVMPLQSCCSRTDLGMVYRSYTTYQPNYYGAGYGIGYGNAGYGWNGYTGAAPYGVNYNPAYVYASPNPYGYYPNGAIWGSSGPHYGRPFPVWNSPSGYYGYRYNGWGSYGWGGWGGTGPAGWGYQGGFYW